MPVMTMLTLKAEREPAFEDAVSVRVAHVLAPAFKLVLAGVQDTLRKVPAFVGVQAAVVIDRVSAMFPMFFM